jgi:hypothetical protein
MNSLVNRALQIHETLQSQPFGDVTNETVMAKPVSQLCHSFMLFDDPPVSLHSSYHSLPFIFFIIPHSSFVPSDHISVEGNIFHSGGAKFRSWQGYCLS